MTAEVQYQNNLIVYKFKNNMADMHHCKLSMNVEETLTKCFHVDMKFRMHLTALKDLMSYPTWKIWITFHVGL